VLQKLVSSILVLTVIFASITSFIFELNKSTFVIGELTFKKASEFSSESLSIESVDVIMLSDAVMLYCW